MKKVSTVAAKQSRKISEQKLTVGLDLGDRSSWYCVLDEAGAIVLEQKLGTTPKAMKEVFGAIPRSPIALETGMHSPWVSRALSELGHEVIVAHARNVRLIGESRKKDDQLDAQTLARLARIDPQLLCPVKHRSAKAQADLTVMRGASRVGARTDCAGKHGAWTGQVLWGAAARVQRAQYESRESGGLESGTAARLGAVAGRASSR
jgi:transposase